MITELRELVVCRNDLEAHVIKGLLEENQIEVLIRKDDCGGMEPQLQITEGVKVLVPSHQLQQAKNLLDDHHMTNGSDKSSNERLWECRSCGEKLEMQFSDCWKCGTSKEVFSA
jgi:hypothetical protein